MWDNITPLKLLETMPENLEDDHLEKLQLLLEADRYKNQIIAGSDLCGTYAPICEGCNKEGKYPCAVAYLNYLKSQADDSKATSNAPNEGNEIAEENEEPSPVVESVEPTPAIENVEEPTQAHENREEEISPVVEAEEVVDEVKSEEESNAPEQEPQKTRIRIAIARKKTI